MSCEWCGQATQRCANTGQLRRATMPNAHLHTLPRKGANAPRVLSPRWGRPAGVNIEVIVRCVRHAVLTDFRHRVLAAANRGEHWATAYPLCRIVLTIPRRLRSTGGLAFQEHDQSPMTRRTVRADARGMYGPDALLECAV